MIRKLMAFWSRLNTFEANNLDDARRGRLLNVILGGTFLISILMFPITIALLSIYSAWGQPGVSLIFLAVIICGIGSLLLLWFNQYFTRLTGILFLSLLSIAMVFSDTPAQLSNGRSSFTFFFVIAISSVILSPASSFLFAIINTIIVICLALISGTELNPTIIAGFYLLALISWLSSRSLEQALKDLRSTNAELDQRVVERTRELSDALSRETLEAERREAILNSIADGVIVFDSNGAAILANPSTTTLINKSQEKIFGSRFSDLLDSDEVKVEDRGRAAALLEKSAQDLSNFRVEWGKRTISINAANVLDDQHRSIGTVAVLRDFTHEAELERMKNTFLAIVSHELRTPLNAILGYAEMLKESVYGRLNEKQQSVSMRIMTNTQRLLNIVSDLLDQTQIEAGKLKIQAIPCRPIELLDNLYGVMEKLASDKGIALSTELDQSMPPVIIGDPHRLQQIMVNLTNNAVKFTDKGSVHVKVYSCGDGKSWQIQVSDTGKGIPEDAMGYIFESFRQVESSSTRQQGGFGLGLSIVKQLVDLMAGKITVESEIEKGSIFTVTLPLVVGEVTTP
jgi:PAS domain S-box-containing protein